jgi:hypothetical protein
MMLCIYIKSCIAQCCFILWPTIYASIQCNMLYWPTLWIPFPKNILNDNSNYCPSTSTGMFFEKVKQMVSRSFSIWRICQIFYGGRIVMRLLENVPWNLVLSFFLSKLREDSWFMSTVQNWYLAVFRDSYQKFDKCFIIILKMKNSILKLVFQLCDKNYEQHLACSVDSRHNLCLSNTHIHFE